MYTMKKKYGKQNEKGSLGDGFFHFHFSFYK